MITLKEYTNNIYCPFTGKTIIIQNTDEDNYFLTGGLMLIYQSSANTIEVREDINEDFISKINGDESYHMPELIQAHFNEQDFIIINLEECKPPFIDDQIILVFSPNGLHKEEFEYTHYDV